MVFIMQLHLSLIAQHRDSVVILLGSGGAGMEVLGYDAPVYVALYCTQSALITAAVCVSVIHTGYHYWSVITALDQ